MQRLMFGVTLFLFTCALVGAQEPLDPSQWPPNTDFSQEVHYWAADYFLPIPEDSQFIDTLTILSGGDQATADVEIGEALAKKANAGYFNVADEWFDYWPDIPVVDVLVQYFANAESKRDNFGFLIGQLTNHTAVFDYEGEPYTFESVADRWEWRLFRIDNSEGRIGDLFDPSVAGTQYGGVNGGTIRFEGATSLIIRAVAFGPQGVFGEPEDINVAGGGVDFNPDDYGIAAEWDLNNGVVDGLDLYIVNGGDQEVVISEDIGPADDKRKAARPAMGDGQDANEDPYMNWEILDERFGPTSQPSTRIKVVAEYYDDPELAGTVFGPEAYVTAGGGFAFYPDAERTVLEGTGKWREDVWYVTDVKFDGVNVPDGQAAARFHFTGPVYISRMRVGVIRSTGQYEGVDPIPDVYPFNPDPYEIYAELDFNEGVELGLHPGPNGGDQEYFIEDAGPAGDIRTAVRPALNEGADFNFDRFINFQLEEGWFGPTDQPNAKIKIAADYYDDPELAGERFGPEVYQTSLFGQLQFAFYPSEQRTTLEGTGEWRVAAWQIDNMNFSGVNCSPAAARFWFTDNGAIYISRVRYAVIRPVGEHAGVDMLEDVPLTPVVDWQLH